MCWLLRSTNVWNRADIVFAFFTFGCFSLINFFSCGRRTWLSTELCQLVIRVLRARQQVLLLGMCAMCV